MTVLSSLYGIIMDLAINAPGHGFVLDGLNANGQKLFEGKLELLGKL